ncbi:putative protein kinase RLK-Pelle-SD-2b family [Helianthus debilis subsp. tardiflorus]
MRNNYLSSFYDIESSLDEEYDPLRIPLKDILSATGNFAEENLLKQSGTAYKGVLLLSKALINVVVRRFSRSVIEEYEFDFETEVFILSRIKHRNVVSFIGFCVEKGERIIVMEHVVHGSLDKYLIDPRTLTWSQTLHICYGCALALRYIQNDMQNIDPKYCHQLIKSSDILLDRDKEAKVPYSVFGLDINQSDTVKSDVHSLGVILLEVLCWGQKRFWM